MKKKGNDSGMGGVRHALFFPILNYIVIQSVGWNGSNIGENVVLSQF